MTNASTRPLRYAMVGGERIDFVSIVTPNDLHYPVAKAFTEAGIHVVCDKPLVHTSAQANDLLQASARAVLMASQVETGCENDIRLRVFGSLGALDWRQEDPNHLLHSPIDGARRTLTRGSPGLSASAKNATRLPAGHPEAFIEAFANIYLGVAADIRARQAGHSADPTQADYPTLADGARGVRFIEQVIASAASGGQWTGMSG